MTAHPPQPVAVREVSATMSKKAKWGKFSEGLTDKQVERLLYEGICPNCANDECINDARGSLWCPACGEAYGEYFEDNRRRK